MPAYVCLPNGTCLTGTCRPALEGGDHGIVRVDRADHAGHRAEGCRAGGLGIQDLVALAADIVPVVQDELHHTELPVQGVADVKRRGALRGLYRDDPADVDLYHVSRSFVHRTVKDHDDGDDFQVSARDIDADRDVVKVGVLNITLVKLGEERVFILGHGSTSFLE